MRALVFMALHAPDVGGIESLCGAVHPRLAARGVDVTVVAGTGPRSQPGVSEIDGILVHRLELRSMVESGDPRRIASGVAAVAAIRDRVAPDVVHVHLSGPEVLFHTLGRGSKKVPLLVTIHNSPRALGLGGNDGLYRSTLEAADWVTAVSVCTLDEVRDVLPGIVDRSSVIASGVEIPEPRTDGVDRGHFALIGRLVDQKAPEVAVDALARVRDAGHDAHLTIAGDGACRGALEDRVERLGMGAAVTFAGSLDRDGILRLLRRTAAVVMPSRWEGLPLSALEAGAAGVPVIASAVGGLADLVTDRVTGRSLTEPDAAAIAAAMTEIVAAPELAATWGAALRRRIEARHGIDACVDAYAEVYHRLGGSR